MELKTGDTVVVDGKTSYIETSWGAGKYRIFKLKDGREIMDLHLLIENGVAQLIKQPLKLISKDDFAKNKDIDA